MSSDCNLSVSCGFTYSRGYFGHHFVHTSFDLFIISFQRTSEIHGTYQIPVFVTLHTNYTNYPLHVFLQSRFPFT